MYGINADGWLAVHHVAHRELIERAQRPVQRTVRRQRRTAPPVAAPVALSTTAVVCC